ncbi:ROK family protein [Azospirillum sp. RWY-5-1]|uniref:ROK family protein n=2 Tax=Azospirillum oleiclasticum TaxID=2735135 RepID=A0ABX2T7F7_9PROT|nr:ROK family protein [Azospirillum oleiclasticum]NYZ18859.1 ROK family protein [Azospirillum oleiclasticum]
MNRIGIDLGGTKTEGIVLDGAGHVLARRRVATPRGDYDGTLSTIRDLVGTLERETAGGGRATVGVGIPGIVSPATGLVKNANSTWLIGRPFDRDLATALGRPVRVENDANCLAVSEAVDGAGAGAGVVFAAIVGTGCGAGIVAHGHVLSGRNAVGGEWGHNPLPWPRDDERPGPACYCGKRGCLETFVSGPAVAADHRRVSGADLTMEGIVAEAADGKADALATLDRLADRLARGLAAVVNLLDPDVIVLGGGLSNVEALYAELPPRIETYAFSDRIDTPVRRAVHGDSSGVRGAAWLWRPEEAAGA